MSLGITELELTDVTTISIPTDAILILSLIIIFALLGYFFHNILENQINHIIEKIDESSHLELVTDKSEAQLTLESKTVKQEKLEKQKIKKLSFLKPTKVLWIGSLAFVGIGGSSLLSIQALQNLYKGVHTIQANIKTENQSTKPLLSLAKIKSSNQDQTKIKNINYIDPLLSTNFSSNNDTFHQIKERQVEDFFSF